MDESKGRPESDQGSYSELVNWICNTPSGFVHHNLELKGEDSRRGIFATRPIARGETLVSLPADHAISGSHLPVSCMSGRDASDWLRCIAAYFEAQHNCDRFQPYLESLPQHYESLLDWSDQEIDSYLAGTSLCNLVQQDRRERILQTRYQEGVRPYLDHLGLIPDGDDELFDFRTACMCISTRGFHVEGMVGGTYSGPFLLPWIDLLNHNPSQKCTTLKWDNAKNCFYMKAEREIESGEEVYHAYGTSLTSVQVLQTFGFVPDEAIKAAINNAEDEDHITSTFLSKSEVLASCGAVAKSSFPSRVQAYMSTVAQDEDERWELNHDMSSRDLSALPSEFLISKKDPLSDELLTACSILFLPDDVYAEFIKEEISRLDASMLDDFYLGKLVCQSIACAVTEKLAAFAPICIDGELGENREDESLLQELCCSQQPGLRRAIYGLVVRLEEKRCLASLLATLQSISNALGGTLIDGGERAGKKLKR